jgi:hypothetical protein
MSNSPVDKYFVVSPTFAKPAGACFGWFLFVLAAKSKKVLNIGCRK